VNPVHRIIIDLLRTYTVADENPLGMTLAGLTDEATVRYVFSNYRNNGGRAKGLQLTETGLQLMKCYFKAYEIKTPESHSIASTFARLPKARHLAYLDRHATLPYFCNAEYVTLFEISLGTKLKLAGGDIQILIDMDHVAF
jgi:hypothetical protein